MRITRGLLASGGADVESPCRRLCTLNDSDICVGCGRSIHEITEWMGATASRKRAIADAAAARLSALQAGRHLDGGSP